MASMRKLITVVLVLLSATVTPAVEDLVDVELAKGIRQVQVGDFDSGIATLDWVTRRLAAERGRPKELARAYVYLSIAYLGLSQEQKAKAQFVEALKTDRALDLDSAEFPPKVLRFFEEARREAFPEAAPPTPRPTPSGHSMRTLGLLGIGAAAGVAVISTASSLDPEPVGDPARTPTPTPVPRPAGSAPSLTILSSDRLPGTIRAGGGGVVLRVQTRVVVERSGLYSISAGVHDAEGRPLPQICGSTPAQAFTAREPRLVTTEVRSPCSGAELPRTGQPVTISGLSLELREGNGSLIGQATFALRDDVAP